MDNKELATYIERHIVPEVVAQSPEESDPLGHWLTTLRAADKLPDHDWNNLLCVIIGYAHLSGQSYAPAIDYCRSQMTSQAGQRRLNVYLDADFFEECRHGEHYSPV